jgi:hypothetical protein
MAETINWSVTFDAVLGPRVSAAGSQVVDAYDKLSLQLDANAVDVDFDLQPSGNGGDVDLLVLRSSAYDADVTFSADGGTSTFTLNGPVVLIGSGSVALLADPPQALRLSNPSANPVDIDILVGRQA